MPLTGAKAAEFEPELLVRISARESGLPRDWWAKCDQVVTVPTFLLGPKAGRLDPETIERLDDALRFVLGL